MRLPSAVGPAAVSEEPAELPGEPAELSAATAGAVGGPADPVGPPAVLTVLIEATANAQVRASTTSTATPAAVSRADRRRANVLAASPSRCHRITFAPLAADPVEKQDGGTGDPGWPAHGHESDTSGATPRGTRSGGGRRTTQPGRLPDWPAPPDRPAPPCWPAPPGVGPPLCDSWLTFRAKM
jgi:hypothetical protein